MLLNNIFSSAVALDFASFYTPGLPLNCMVQQTGLWCNTTSLWCNSDEIPFWVFLEYSMQNVMMPSQYDWNSSGMLDTWESFVSEPFLFLLIVRN